MKRRRATILASGTVALALAATAAVVGLQSASARGRDHHLGQRHRTAPAATTEAAVAEPSSVSTAAPSTTAVSTPPSASSTNTASSTSAASPTTTKTPATTAAAECGAGTSQAEVTRSGSTWTAKNGSKVVYTGKDMPTAVQTAITSLTPDRTKKERVVVRGSGTMPASTRIKMASYTTLDWCGTITATGAQATDTAPISGWNLTDVEVQHLDLVGTPMYGIFMRKVNNLKLGQITMDLKGGGGIGVRDDNKHEKVKSKGLTIDHLTVSNSTSHALETAGIDGIDIGTVTARDVGEAGVLLGVSTNARIDLIDAVNTGTGTGYAAFRMANQNGLIDGKYPTNIRIGTVKARGGGRGIFCVSESGGVTVDKVDLENTGNNAILIQNCHNVDIAAQGGTITGGGEIRIAARDEFANNTDVTLGEFTLKNSKITETPCVADKLKVTGLTLVNSTEDRC